MDEAQAKALLKMAAAVPPPDGGVDVALARRRGRRYLRRRRAGLAGLTGLAVLAVIVVPARILAPGHAAGGRHVAASHTPGAAVTPPRQFNPLIPYVAFGWLPSGVSADGGQLSADVANITAGHRAAWAAEVFAADHCRHRGAQLLCDLHSSRIGYRLGAAAPRIDGHRAYWTTAGKELVWQYTRDSWAALSPAPDAPVGEIVKVARTLRYRVATRPSIRFPVQLTRMSPAWHVISMYFQYDSGVPRASQYDLAGGRGAPSVTTDPATRRSSCSSTPGQSVRKTINGYRVIVTHLPAQRGNPAVQQLCAAFADGLSLFYSTYGDHASPNAVALFARHTRLLGAHPADWTTRPLT